MKEISFAIRGQAFSKANSRQLTRIANSPRIIKSKPALAYAKSFRQQMPAACDRLTLPVIAHIAVWYGSRRPDLDESLILDLLQYNPKVFKDEKGVIVNDRQVREKHVYWGLDPDDPRMEIRLVECQELDPPKAKKVDPPNWLIRPDLNWEPSA